MPQKRETRGARRSRAPLMSAVQADLTDNSQSCRELQADRLLRQFKFSPAVARIVAEHAFGMEVVR